MASCVILSRRCIPPAALQHPSFLVQWLMEVFTGGARAAEEESAWGLDLMIGLGDGWT